MPASIQIASSRRLVGGLAVLSLCLAAAGCGSGSAGTARPGSAPAAAATAKTRDSTGAAPFAAAAAHSAVQKCLNHPSPADVLTCLAASGANIRSDGPLYGCLHGAQSRDVVVACLRKALG
jgi:hypothetical protein